MLQRGERESSVTINRTIVCCELGLKNKERNVLVTKENCFFSEDHRNVQRTSKLALSLQRESMHPLCTLVYEVSRHLKVQ